MKVPSYRDQSNLQGKVQKHEKFGAEVAANEARIKSVDSDPPNPRLLDGYAADSLLETPSHRHTVYGYTNLSFDLGAELRAVRGTGCAACACAAAMCG